MRPWCQLKAARRYLPPGHAVATLPRQDSGEGIVGLERLPARAVGEERRKEPRFYWCEEGTIRVPPFTGESEYAEVLDVSRSGVGLLTGRRLDIGAEIILHVSKAVIFGRVRHTTALGLGLYRVGLEITDLIAGHE